MLLPRNFEKTFKEIKDEEIQDGVLKLKIVTMTILRLFVIFNTPVRLI
jgi:hypothetical protein